jgi:hypothetical protein
MIFKCHNTFFKNISSDLNIYHENQTKDYLESYFIIFNNASDLQFFNCICKRNETSWKKIFNEEIFERIIDLHAPQSNPSNSIERTLRSSSSIFVSSSHGLTSRTMLLFAIIVGSKIQR